MVPPGFAADKSRQPRLGVNGPSRPASVIVPLTGNRPHGQQGGIPRGILLPCIRRQLSEGFHGYFALHRFSWLFAYFRGIVHRGGEMSRSQAFVILSRDCPFVRPLDEAPVAGVTPYCQTNPTRESGA